MNILVLGTFPVSMEYWILRIAPRTDIIRYQPTIDEFVLCINSRSRQLEQTHAGLQAVFGTFPKWMLHLSRQNPCMEGLSTEHTCLLQPCCKRALWEVGWAIASSWCQIHHGLGPNLTLTNSMPLSGVFAATLRFSGCSTQWSSTWKHGISSENFLKARTDCHRHQKPQSLLTSETQESWSIGCKPLFDQPIPWMAWVLSLFRWSSPKIVPLTPCKALGQAETLSAISFCRKGAGLLANLGQSPTIHKVFVEWLCWWISCSMSSGLLGLLCHKQPCDPTVPNLFRRLWWLPKKWFWRHLAGCQEHHKRHGCKRGILLTLADNPMACKLWTKDQIWMRGTWVSVHLKGPNSPKHGCAT